MDGATPKMAVVMQEAANEEGSKDHVDSNDVYGQLVTAGRGSDIVNDTVTYTAITYYNLGDIMTVTPSWEYNTYINYTTHGWTDATAKSIDNRMSVNVVNTPLGQLKQGDKYYNASYPEWYAVKSVMKITNPVMSMYDTSTMKKYFISHKSLFGHLLIRERTICTIGAVYGDFTCTVRNNHVAILRFDHFGYFTTDVVAFFCNLSVCQFATDV